MRFSRRTPGDLAENRIARSLRGRTRPYLDLTESNPTRAGLSPAEEEIARAFSRPGIGLYRPDPRGLLSAREAVAGYYRERGVEADPDRLFLTASTSEAYAFLFKLLCDPGEAVLLPEPSYPLFDHLTDLEGIRRISYRLLPEGHWGIDLSGVEAGLAAGARAVLLVNPNNPTGTFLKGHELAELARLAAARGAALISDEVFLDFAFGPDPARVPVAAAAAGEALAFSLGGLSKSCALPQVKLAWILAAGPEREIGEALPRLELIADTYLSVSTPAQIALPALLEAGAGSAAAIRRRVRENLASLDRLLAELPASAGVARLPSEGGWYAILRLPSTRSEEELVLALLEEHGVLVQPGWFFNFPCEAFLVVSLLPEPDVFREGAVRVLALAAGEARGGNSSAPSRSD